MKHSTILWHVFELDERAYQYLNAYIDRIDRYASEHSIDPELVNDIKYNVIEKLYALTAPIAEADVMNIAQELWEPEQIFGTEENASDTESVHWFWNSNTLTRWLSTPKPLLGWVSYWIASAFKVPVWLIRLIFLVLVLVYWTWIWGYIILALFVPYKDKSSTIGKSGNLFFEIIRVMIRLLILFGLGSAILAWSAGVILFPLFPSISNQSLQALMPSYFYPVAIVMIVALLMLFIWAFGALVRKHRTTRTLTLTSIVVLVLGAIALIRIPVGLYFNELASSEQSNTSTILSGSKVPETLHIQILGEKDKWAQHHDISSTLFSRLSWPQTAIEFVASKDDTIRIDVEDSFKNISNIHDRDIAAQRSSVSAELSGNMLTITIPENLFVQEVPMSFAQRLVSVSLPKTTEFSYNEEIELYNWRLSSEYWHENFPQDNFRQTTYCLNYDLYRYYPALKGWRCAETELEVVKYDEEDELFE